MSIGRLAFAVGLFVLLLALSTCGAHAEPTTAGVAWTVPGATPTDPAEACPGENPDAPSIATYYSVFVYRAGLEPPAEPAIVFPICDPPWTPTGPHFPPAEPVPGTNCVQCYLNGPTECAAAIPIPDDTGSWTVSVTAGNDRGESCRHSASLLFNYAPPSWPPGLALQATVIAEVLVGPEGGAVRLIGSRIEPRISSGGGALP